MSFEVVTDIRTAETLRQHERMEKGDFHDVDIGPTSIKVLATRRNLESMLDSYGIDVYYDRLSKEMHIDIPWLKTKDLNSANGEIYSLASLNSYPKTEIKRALVTIAMENIRNPVHDWICSASWDGVDRFMPVCDEIQVKTGYEEAKKIYLRRWFYSAVAMLENKCGRRSNEGVLVFQGAQGKGKSKWLRGLMSEAWDYYLGEITIDPHSKDSVYTAVSGWIGEVAELDATFKKSEQSALKQFFTKSFDRVRLPYGEFYFKFPRTTVYYATVNDPMFLKDNTGDRRYWCLPIESIKIPDDFNSQQFWAQMKHEMNSAECSPHDPWFLSPEEIELRNSLNADFREIDPIDEAIESRFIMKPDCKLFRMTATQIAGFIGHEKPSQALTTKIGKIVTEKFGPYKKTSKGRFYTVPCPRGYNDKELGISGIEKINK